jgi:hypothetical protein
MKQARDFPYRTERSMYLHAVVAFDFQSVLQYFWSAMVVSVLALLVYSFAVGGAQQLQKRNSLLERQPESVFQPTVEARKVFEQVERGLETGSVESLYPVFAAQLSVSMEGRENGTFSNNQVVALLKNFFAQRTPISFSFSKMAGQATNPYATGTLVYAHKGTQRRAQVYVSLIQRESRWVINQFNIY